jgi:hypothetical protein
LLVLPQDLLVQRHGLVDAAQPARSVVVKVELFSGACIHRGDIEWPMLLHNAEKDEPVDARQPDDKVALLLAQHNKAWKLRRFFYVYMSTTTALLPLAAQYLNRPPQYQRPHAIAH